MASAGPTEGQDSSQVLGLRLAPLDEAARSELDLGADARGVLVVGVDSGPAETVLRPGDVIVEVGGEAVKAPDDVAHQVSEAKDRSEAHTSELQSLMRHSYAVFCLKQKKDSTTQHTATSNDI